MGVDAPALAQPAPSVELMVVLLFEARKWSVCASLSRETVGQRGPLLATLARELLKLPTR
jgi:hypothetical protein